MDLTFISPTLISGGILFCSLAGVFVALKPQGGGISRLVRNVILIWAVWFGAVAVTYLACLAISGPAGSAPSMSRIVLELVSLLAAGAAGLLAILGIIRFVRLNEDGSGVKSSSLQWAMRVNVAAFAGLLIAFAAATIADDLYYKRFSDKASSAASFNIYD